MFGFTEEQLLAYVFPSGNASTEGWKRLERRKRKDAWLERQMKECFPTCGFPQFRIDELKRAEDSELIERKDIKDGQH